MPDETAVSMFQRLPFLLMSGFAAMFPPDFEDGFSFISLAEGQDVVCIQKSPFCSTAGPPQTKLGKRPRDSAQRRLRLRRTAAAPVVRQRLIMHADLAECIAGTSARTVWCEGPERLLKTGRGWVELPGLRSSGGSKMERPAETEARRYGRAQSPAR